MKRNILFLIFSICFLMSSAAGADDKTNAVPFTQSDKERLITLEAKSDALNQRINDLNQSINQRINDLDTRMQKQGDDLKGEIKNLRTEMQKMNDNFTSSMQKINDSIASSTQWIITILFTSMIALVGFVLWDRRSTVLPVEQKQAEQESQVIENKHDILKIKQENQIMKKMLAQLATLKPETAELAKQLGL